MYSSKKLGHIDLQPTLYDLPLCKGTESSWEIQCFPRTSWWLRASQYSLEYCIGSFHFIFTKMQCYAIGWHTSTPNHHRRWVVTSFDLLILSSGFTWVVNVHTIILMNHFSSKVKIFLFVKRIFLCLPFACLSNSLLDLVSLVCRRKAVVSRCTVLFWWDASLMSSLMTRDIVRGWMFISCDVILCLRGGFRRIPFSPAVTGAGVLISCV